MQSAALQLLNKLELSPRPGCRSLQLSMLVWALRVRPRAVLQRWALWPCQCLSPSSSDMFAHTGGILKQAEGLTPIGCCYPMQLLQQGVACPTSRMQNPAAGATCLPSPNAAFASLLARVKDSSRSSSAGQRNGSVSQQTKIISLPWGNLTTIMLCKAHTLEPLQNGARDT